MLYLEDYLEMIEHLPQELRDRFTQIREMDLQVQNDLDKLEFRVNKFFGNAKELEVDIREAQYQQIYQDYTKTIEDSEEKVTQAKQIYDLIDKYMRRLDIELQKFKIELEADNAGITEVIEKRVEKEYEAKQNSPSQLMQKKKLIPGKRYDKNGARLFMPGEKPAGNGDKYSQKLVSSQPAYLLPKGRTKNSSDSQPQYPSPMATDGDPMVSDGDFKNKKRNKRARNSTSYTTNYPDVESSTSSDFLGQEYSTNASEEEVFCVCRGVSYGEMIQCENEKSCPFEWFHYSCIGMKQAPKGSWYCEYCNDNVKTEKNPEKKKKKREKSVGAKDKALGDYVY